jgi:tetratricopeptide (TPR) repeat protein
MNDPGKEALALECVIKADKKMKSGYLSRLFNPVNYEEVSQHYIKAGNIYNMLDKREESGDCFIKAAEALSVNVNSEEYDEVSIANQYVNAGNSYVKCNKVSAIESYKKAVEFFCQKDKHSTASRYQKVVAELLVETNEIELAIDAYQFASKLYSCTNSDSMELNMYNAKAALCAQIGRYIEAVEDYDKYIACQKEYCRIGKQQYIFNSLICLLCSELESKGINNFRPEIVVQKLEKYMNEDSTFERQIEHTCIRDILNAIKEEDQTLFEKAVTDYDKLVRLTPLRVSILSKIKSCAFDSDSDSDIL